MAKTKETTEAEEGTRVGLLHEKHAAYIKRTTGRDVDPEDVFAVYNTRNSFRGSKARDIEPSKEYAAFLKGRDAERKQRDKDREQAKKDREAKAKERAAAKAAKAKEAKEAKAAKEAADKEAEAKSSEGSKAKAAKKTAKKSTGSKAKAKGSKAKGGDKAKSSAPF